MISAVEGAGPVTGPFDSFTPPAASQEFDHWAPLYLALGAANPDGAFTSSRDVTVDGFWYGLSKRSWQFGARPSASRP